MDHPESSEEALRRTTGFLASLLEKVTAFLPTLLVALVVFLLGLLLARLIQRLLRRAAARTKMDSTAAGFGMSLIRIVIYTLLVIICLSILGVPTASMITVVGAAGVTIGLALQNSLSNLAGGFILLFSKPFTAGDYIVVGSEEGYVESVKILYTKLISRDNRAVYIPNGNLASGNLVNLSEQGTLKVYVPLSISYDAEIERARAVLLEMIKGLPTVLQDPPPSVTVSALSESGVELSVNVMVKTEDYFTAPSLVLEQAKAALTAAGIEIPYPQICVHSSAHLPKF